MEKYSEKKKKTSLQKYLEELKASNNISIIISDNIFLVSMPWLGLTITAFFVFKTYHYHHRNHNFHLCGYISLWLISIKLRKR